MVAQLLASKAIVVIYDSIPGRKTRFGNGIVLVSALIAFNTSTSDCTVLSVITFIKAAVALLPLPA